MIIRKIDEFRVVTESGERVIVSRYKKVAHDYDNEKGFYEADNKSRLLIDHFGRHVNCIQEGNYQIIGDDGLIDAFSEELMAVD